MSKWLVVLSLVFGVSTTAHANLILNGSFENNDIKSNSWKAFTAGTVDGWSGTNMELWDNFQGLNAFDGSQYAELNANGNNGRYFIFQSFSTEADATYDVSFAYAARGKGESFQLDIFSDTDNILFSQVFDDHAIKTWSEFYGDFVAQTALTTIRFSTINTGTYGNFVDDIVVTEAPRLASVSSVSVSEPASLAILLPLSAFAFIRRRRAKQIYTYGNYGKARIYAGLCFFMQKYLRFSSNVYLFICTTERILSPLCIKSKALLMSPRPMV